MACVLDVSVSLTWYLPGQSNPYATEIYRRLNSGELRAGAPVLWRTELASVLLKICRRHQITETHAYAALADAEALPVALHDLQLTAVELYRLGQRYNLSGYDVHYLELARRLNMPIATNDRGIRSAARAHRIALYSA